MAITTTTSLAAGSLPNRLQVGCDDLQGPHNRDTNVPQSASHVAPACTDITLVGRSAAHQTFHQNREHFIKKFYKVLYLYSFLVHDNYVQITTRTEYLIFYVEYLIFGPCGHLEVLYWIALCESIQRAKIFKIYKWIDWGCTVFKIDFSSCFTCFMCVYTALSAAVDCEINCI